MEAETCDQRRVDALAIEIEKLAHEREVAEAKIRGWIKRAVDAEKADGLALAARGMKLMERAKARLGMADEKLRGAVEALEHSLDQAFSYEALLRRVSPLTMSLGAVDVLPGDETPELERKRAANHLASRVSAAYYVLLEKIDKATRWAWQPSDDPLENFDRLDAILLEIESSIPGTKSEFLNASSSVRAQD
jgi:hypothetical protein